MEYDLELVNVGKVYDNGTPAVIDFNLRVTKGEFIAFLGPSGCGKTTTLRMINRLIEPSGGRILIDGENVLTMNPVTLRRGIGYVIQQGGLFPHKRIAENVATGAIRLTEEELARLNELHSKAG